MSILPLAHINAYFILDGKKYEVEKFKISFNQAIDFKGQPQHEERGGKLLVTIPQIADDNLYLWAKTPTLTKGGEVIFQTDLGITVLRINFTNAYCINLTRETGSYCGTSTMMLISPENITLNGVEHENFWKQN